jgi:SAM-dependent methyltransferase
MGIINRTLNLMQDLLLSGNFLDDIIPKKFVKINNKLLHPPHSTSYFILRKITSKRIVENINFINYDNFYDIGCGYGRVLLFMNKFFSKQLLILKLTGIEFEKEIACKCINNVRNEKIIIINDDALKVDYRDNSIFYLFNPLNEQDLELFINKVETLENFLIVFWGHNKFHLFDKFNPVVIDFNGRVSYKVLICKSK